MSYVYADLDALIEFQQEIFQILPIIGQIPYSCEDIVSDAKNVLEDEVMRTQEGERMANNLLRIAEHDLIDAERTYSSIKDEDGNSMEVPEFYKDMVDERSEDLRFAEVLRQGAELRKEYFDGLVSSVEAAQQASLEHIHRLMEKSNQFLDEYIELLTKAKECIADLV